MIKPKITTPTESFVKHYPQFAEMADTQQRVRWTWDEIDVQKDIQDILTNMTDSERHGVITTLRLFTLYELKIGCDAWSGVMTKRYPRPEIIRMALEFASVEVAIHQPFYERLNDLLNLNTDKFYLGYVDSPVLKQRIGFIDKLLESSDPLVSTGVFTFLEGVILYSSFAYLKHFQSQGKNKLVNVNRGINFSCQDEQLHCTATAELFKQHCKEDFFANLDDVKQKILEAAKVVYEHEEQIIEMIFEQGEIKGITKEDMKTFVKSRVNLCLRDMGYEDIYTIQENPISEWFYDGITNYHFNDFFSGQGREYQRNWDEEGFIWGDDK